MAENHMSRRSVLAAGAAGAAIAVVPRHVLGGPGQTPPSEKINVAGIGVGGMGFGNLVNITRAGGNIVALCDVDHKYAGRALNRYKDAKRYKDFRELFAKQADIDAVLIATPDHTHAVATLAAIKAGKHVYTQKPLTHDVYEARVLALAAKKAGVTTQMGIQGHSGEGIRLVCEWIWDGAIGTIRRVDAWCSLSYYPWGHAGWSSKWGRKPKEKPPVPEGMDWDLWIGPAPMRPYHRAYHPATWRAWLDFGSGMMGDRGAHTLDAVFWAMKLNHPISVDATSMGLNPDTHPLASVVTYEYGPRGAMPPVTVRWFDGMKPPRPAEAEDGRRLGDNEGGVIFKGDKGMITCGTYGNGPRLMLKNGAKAGRPPKKLPRVVGSHEKDWLDGCRAGKPSGADFAYSGPLTEMTALANVAKRVNTRILWDGANLKVTNIPQANQYVRTPYRKGWSLD